MGTVPFGDRFGPLKSTRILAVSREQLPIFSQPAAGTHNLPFEKTRCDAYIISVSVWTEILQSALITPI
jgi:hypothetical protein